MKYVKKYCLTTINALDKLSVSITKQIISNISKTKKGVVIITSHHAQDILDLCDEIIYIENGMIKKIESNHIKKY